MSTTTVRLNTEDRQILDNLAPLFGGKSNAIRQALRSLASDTERQLALDSFLEGWEAEAGPVDEEAVVAMARRYGL
jgi:predicted transcriptional regulator